MTALSIPQYSQPEDAAILSKAFLRAGQELHLNQREMAQVLGASEPHLSRLAREAVRLSPKDKQGEIALTFLRFYRSLNGLFGGRAEDMRAWFAAPNHFLGGIPRELIKTLTGLFRVVEYLDAMRGRV